MTGPRLALFARRPRRKPRPDPLDGLDDAARDALQVSALSLVSLLDDGTIRPHGYPMRLLDRAAIDTLLARGLVRAIDDTTVCATEAGKRLAKLSKKRRATFAKYRAKEARWRTGASA